jgi:N-acetylgalactosamine kinase
MLRKLSEINNTFIQNHPVLLKHISLQNLIKQNFQENDKIWFIKAPGRVNLIGEHVDYNMGTVLPCAIDREIILCFKDDQSGKIHVSNVNPDFKNIQFSIRDPIKPYSKGHWGNYIKAGIKGILDYIGQSTDLNLQNLNGFNAIISSTLPPAAGLSSSSALVVAAALAILTVNQIPLDNIKIAEICAKAEHFVGTSGGGMDHAACLLGKKDAFLKIEFNPLHVTPISSPGDIEVILFHSLIEAEKSSNVREEYNRRVLECQFSVDLFNLFISNNHTLNIKPPKFIGEITPQYFDIPYAEMENLILEFIDSLPDSYSLLELLSIFNISRDDLAHKYSHILRGSDLTELPGGYKVRGRFRHVYTECQRVDQAVKCLQNKEKIQLGKLLDASHESLANDYEVSTPEVDSIVKLLRQFGAFGTRLVGAGFGGMILTLSDQYHADELIKKMKDFFYSKKPHQKLNNTIIRCKTSDGAGIL